MKVLITGSNGFLGKEVNKLIDKKKFKIFKISRKKLKNYYVCDLENENKVKNLLIQINPDVIINLAANVDFKKKIHYLKINYILPKLLSDYCKKFNKYLIHSSTIAIHGLKEKYSINSKISPDTAYGISKLKGDRAIIKSKCKYTIIRFPGIYGSNGPNHMFINTLMDKNNSLNLRTNNDGNHLRNYVFVKDAANIILNCLKKKSKKIIYAGGKKLSIKKMLILIKKNKLIKNIKFGKKKYNDQIVISNFKFQYTTFGKSIGLIKNQQK